MAVSPVRIVVMEGDGIGPEITAATLAVLRAADRAFGLGLSFTAETVGFAALRASGTTFPDAAEAAARAADGVILGPVSHNDYPPVAQGGLNPSGELRKRLDLYANIRPARSRGGFPPRCGAPVDLVVVRENTEGFYADRNMFMGSGEFMPTPDVALAVRKITRAGRDPDRRGGLHARHAAPQAGDRGAQGQRAAGVGRASISTARGRSAARFPQVRYEEKIIDAMAALLVRDAAALRRDRHHQHVRRHPVRSRLRDRRQPRARGVAQCRRRAIAVAQAQHGSAPDIAGQDIANPASLIGSAAMLLAWLGERRSDNRLRAAAAAIESALDRAIARPEWRTRDLGGPLGTQGIRRAGGGVGRSD